MAADKIIRNTKLDTFLSKLATKLTAIFWRKAETTEVAVDSTPTANSNNLVKSGGVKSYVDNAIPDEVVANPTVPSGTTPTDLQNLKIGNNYYGIPTSSASLDDLTDVNLGTPANGDVLTYDSTSGKWIADEPQGGELSTNVTTDKTDNTKASTPASVYNFVICCCLDNSFGKATSTSRASWASFLFSIFCTSFHKTWRSR